MQTCGPLPRSLEHSYECSDLSDFRRTVDFSGSTFKAASSFKGCQFWGGAIFDDVRFHVGVFEFSKFMQSASFSHAVFRTVASFRNEMCPLRQHVLATSQSLKMRCSSSPLTGCQPFLLVRRMVPQRIVLVHRLAAAVVSDGTGYRRDPRQVQLVLCNGRASPTIN